MLTSQQSLAKEAARAHFTYATRLLAQSQPQLDPDDGLPRFQPGVAGIGIAGDTVRIYLFQDDSAHADLEIPEHFEGLATVHVHTQGIHAYAPPRQSLLDPVPAGVSIAHSSLAGAGTLGCLVEVPGHRPCILSNTHVLAPDHAGPGDEIHQPGPFDGTSANPVRSIAQLLDWEPLLLGHGVNHIDAAIAETDDVSATCLPQIMTLGSPSNPSVPARVGQDVAKHGRTTGLTFGTVVDLSFDGLVRYPGGTAYFENQIAIEGDRHPFSEPGDSGSLIVASATSQPVALLFAGDGSLTYANPIHSVLNRFGATVAT